MDKASALLPIPRRTCRSGGDPDSPGQKIGFVLQKRPSLNQLRPTGCWAVSHQGYEPAFSHRGGRFHETKPISAVVAQRHLDDTFFLGCSFNRMPGQPFSRRFDAGGFRPLRTGGSFDVLDLVRV